MPLLVNCIILLYRRNLQFWLTLYSTEYDKVCLKFTQVIPKHNETWSINNVSTKILSCFEHGLTVIRKAGSNLSQNSCWVSAVYKAFVGLLNSSTTEKQMTKCLSANFQKMSSPSYIILRLQRLEGKQHRSR